MNKRFEVIRSTKKTKKKLASFDTYDKACDFVDSLPLNDIVKCCIHDVEKI